MYKYERMTIEVNGEVIYDILWTEEEIFNGGKDMHETIIKDIEELIDENRVGRRYATEYHKELLRKNNDTLSRAKTIIKSKNDYEVGANDAWELARKIVLPVSYGCYNGCELEDIFGSSSYTDIFINYTIQEILEKVKEYEKKKEEEAAKPKLGDVVEVHYPFNDVIERGILLATGDTGFNYLSTDGRLTKASYFSGVELKKTGEHVDIQGMLDKIG